MAIKTLSVTVQTDTHIHQGKRCLKGDVIEVDKPTAQFLLRAGVINKIPSLNKEELKNG